MGKSSAYGKKKAGLSNTSSLQKTIFSSKTILFSWKLGDVTGEGGIKNTHSQGRILQTHNFQQAVKIWRHKIPQVLFGIGSYGDRRNIPKVPSIIKNRKDKKREQVRKGK